MLIKLTCNDKQMVVDHNDVLMVTNSDQYRRYLLRLKSDIASDRKGWFIDQSPYEVLELVKKAERLSRFKI